MRRYSIALLLGLLALFPLAACTDDDGDGVSSLDSPGASESAADDGGGGEEDAFQEALAYSECMRENGIEGFPDPEENEGGGIGLSLDKSVDPESDEFKAAEAACEDLRPGPGDDETVDPEVYQALIEYSECMRTNGVEDFPDPEPNGGIMIDSNMGFDTESDEFKAAEEACRDLRPGDGEGDLSEGDE
ncbi:hypothetical protein [Glycomyces paridis]|uniref:Uncharacterized protein n=1 Tax=Glycomyces paridis TaxID=2126555 RepID=A0A4S8PNK4_9ACTN|nr:hypothetical protein [Glycomyces paridis]THV29964.1 hypothetical protein E9998_06110 [Glycomyces paridis]